MTGRMVDVGRELRIEHEPRIDRALVVARTRAAARAARAFTLVELVIALAIAAILAALANASYEQTIRRSRRLDARIALVAVASAQERHYLDHARYASRFDADARDAGGATGSAPDAAQEPDATALPLGPTSPEHHYSLDLATDPDALGYVASARPQGLQRRDRRCAVLTLDHTGHRTARDDRGADSTSTCW